MPHTAISKSQNLSQKSCTLPWCEARTWCAVFRQHKTTLLSDKQRAVPITCPSNKRALSQLVRLHLTNPGSGAVQRIEGTTGARAAERLQGLNEQFAEPPSTYGAVRLTCLHEETRKYPVIVIFLACIPDFPCLIVLPYPSQKPSWFLNTTPSSTSTDIARFRVEPNSNSSFHHTCINA